VKKQRKSKSDSPEIETRKNVLLFWGGGKDSALSLFELKSPEFEIIGLLSTFEAGTDRLQVSDAHRDLVEAQAAACEMLLYSASLPRGCASKAYIDKVGEVITEIRKTKRVDCAAFGNVRLEEVKNFWLEACATWNVEAVFPLWGWSAQLIHQAFFGLGHQAIVHSLDTKKVPPAFLGRHFNASFVRDLPPSVDSCGESAEFQTFVTDGPFFSKPLRIDLGEVYDKEKFQYRELRLKSEALAN
jgi:uncharacterized protein (TIGR00290 family)